MNISISILYNIPLTYILGMFLYNYYFDEKKMSCDEELKIFIRIFQRHDKSIPILQWVKDTALGMAIAWW